VATSSRRSSASARPETSTPRAPGEWSALVGATERLWRRAHLTYDETCEISKLVRARLELARPAIRRGAPPRLGEADQGRLIATAYRTASARGGDTRARGLMVKTLLLTGARVAEFVALRAEDLVVEEAQIRIRKGKGGKSRVVPLLPAHAHELRTHLGARRSGWLFETRSARPYSTRRVQQIVREVAQRAGIVHRVSPHLLRHTVAQHLLDRGMPIDQVRQFLGHEDIKTTQIYAEAAAGAVGASYRRALGDVSARWAGELAPAAPAPLQEHAAGARREPRDEGARPRGKEARPGRRGRAGSGRSRGGRVARGRTS
jgi:integrase/recombinase XerD